MSEARLFAEHAFPEDELERDRIAALDREDLIEDLNPRQREAVLYDGGPLVVVAGAGSGKTRVLTRRIGRILSDGVHPQRILAITFTNKAADEMRNRVRELVGSRVDPMWISTFHSMCVRILRREASSTAWRSGFSIYDDGDSRRLIEHILEDLGVDQKRFPARAVGGAISHAKGELHSAAEYQERSYTIYEERIAQVFVEYERRLIAANAMDFDDLLSETVRLLRRDEEVAARYQDRFLHVLVDEYQDTNQAQNELVVRIGAGHRNVCVVGDSDQSIYRFRGAEVRNLLDFEHAFADAATVVLDQNYRSTQRILDAANAVIGNNMVREAKVLWSALGEGEPIVRFKAGDEREEATFVANEIARLRREASTAFRRPRSSTGPTPRAARSSRRSPTGGCRTRSSAAPASTTAARSATVSRTSASSSTRSTRCRSAGCSTSRGAVSARRA